MADGTSIFGTDTSRYQQIGNYNPGAFEIVNIEDPQWLDKWVRNRAEMRPTGFYIWCYPGHDLAADTRWAIDKARSAGFGDPELGVSLDYEEGGVEEWQIDQYFATCSHMGSKALLYALPSSVSWDRYPDIDWWACVYPGNNDGSFPGYGALWPQSRPRRILLWQYTSGANAAVGLDQNVVVDEPRYFEFIGLPAAVTTPQTLSESDAMIYADDVECHMFQGNVIIVDFNGPRPYGIPQDAYDFANQPNMGQIPIRVISDFAMAALKKAAVVAVTMPDVGVPAEPVEVDVKAVLSAATKDEFEAELLSRLNK